MKDTKRHLRATLGGRMLHQLDDGEKLRSYPTGCMPGEGREMLVIGQGADEKRSWTMRWL